ncbi:MAG: hypothetical protein KDK70_38710 [Myxococcales bacterium]|nr:hypothetical protein [Myxococcales bacterium]
MKARLAALLSCLALGCAGCPTSAPPSTTPSTASTASGETAQTLAVPPSEAIASYRPAALWNALTRDTIPHGWPQDVALRSSREVEYDPSSGLLRIGPQMGAGGKATSIRATTAESVRVVWIPDYVPAQPCPQSASPSSQVLVVARDALREAIVEHREGAALPPDAPRVVVAAVPVEAQCAELADPRWVEEHSAAWRPTEPQKRGHRVVGGGEASAGGVAVHAVFSGIEQLERYGTEPLPRGVLAGLERVDFTTHAVVVIGQGAPRLQHVDPGAIETQPVWAVDVPLATHACRKRQTEGLSKLIYLADDTGFERGRYRVEGSPLLVRPVDEPRHELRFEDCARLFRYWRPVTTHVEPNPSMYLRLYGPTPAKEHKHEDQIVTSLAVTEVGDTFNLAIPLLAPLSCSESGGRPASAKEQAEAHLVRRAVLRRRLVMPRHDGPIRLVPPDRTPYDAVEWDLDAKPCSQAPKR